MIWNREQIKDFVCELNARYCNNRVVTSNSRIEPITSSSYSKIPLRQHESDILFCCEVIKQLLGELGDR